MSSHSKKVLKSSFLLLGTKVVQRFLGLASTLLLARILTPDDFGVIAIAAMTVFLFNVLSTSGSEQYIIRKDCVDSDDLNSAWTLDIILKSSLWFILVISAPYIASFLEKEQITLVLYVLSFRLIIDAFQNPGVYLYKKELEYKRLFYLTVTQKFLSFAVVISIALVTESYWAVIVGDIVSALVGLIGSYIIHTYRPRISKVRIREQWGFSQWMLLKGVLGYARFQMDSLFVSKLFNTADLGRYHLSKDISLMPFSELIMPVAEPLLASFAKVKNDPQKFAYQVRVSIVIVMLLISPICFFMWYFPEPIVDTLLGDQWESTYELFSYFSILLFASCIGIVLTQCFIVTGKVRTIFFYDLYSLAVIGSGLLLFLPSVLEEFALLRGGLQVVATFTLMLLALYLTRFSLFMTLFLSLPILLASYLSASVTGMFELHGELNAFLSLASHVVIFFSVYAAVLLGCYALIYRRYEEVQHIKRLVFIASQGVLDKFSRGRSV